MRLVSLSIAAIALSVSTAALAAPHGVSKNGPHKEAKADARKKTAKRKPLPPPPPPAPEEEEEVAAPVAEPAPPATAESAPAAADRPAATEPRDPVDDTGVSVAPVLGYATNQANLGIGVRGGYTLESGLYLGGTFVYHLGASSESAAGLAGETVETSVRLFYPGVEVGYAIPVGPVSVRPYGGVGVLFAATSMKAGGEEQSDTKSSLAIWPGCTLTYDLPRTSVFIGGDTRLLIATSGGDPSLGLFATAGMRF